jgi:protein SCO1
MKATLLLMVISFASAVSAQTPGDAILRDVDLQQRMGETIPLDTPFVDEAARNVTLREYFQGKPVVLVPAYYECPMLCTLTLTAVAEGLRDVDFVPGKDFHVVVFSINPDEKPSLAIKKKHNYVNLYGRTETADGWHFLTGQPENIRAVTDALGYKFTRDPDTGQYAHPAAIAMISPEGKISRYFFGNDYPAKDMRLGLIDAGEGRVGAVLDRIVARCYVYDPMTGKYGPSVLLALQVAAGVTFLGIVGVTWGVSRRVKRLRLADAEALAGAETDGETATAGRSDSQ